MADSRRRFNIKPFRAHVPMDRSDALETWSVLERAMDEIYNRNASQLSFEELYRNAYNLVLHKHGALLYEGVVDKISSHLGHVVLQDLLQQHKEQTNADSSDPLANNNKNHQSSTSSYAQYLSTYSYPTSTQLPRLLPAVASAWQEHLLTLTMIRDILMYMDRTYVHQAKRRGVYELGLHLWKITVWDHPGIAPAVTSLILQQVAKERQGAIVEDRTCLKNLLQMLLELGQADYSTNVYMQVEQAFLAETQEFYHAESLNYLQYSAMEYVEKATSRIQEEKERSVALMLPSTTEAPLMNIVQTELIERHAKTLVEMEHSGFACMLQDYDHNHVDTTTTKTRLDDMARMYHLFVRVPSSVDHLRDALAERIKADGRALIADQERGVGDPAGFVRGVLAMRAKYDKVVAVGFCGEKKAQKRMREAFEDFLNTDARAASCLAVYVDELLRTGLRGASEEATQEELNRVIVIFRYLADKDVFESFYKQHLAKRLLSSRSVSDEAEKLMVSLLKAECGYQFTTKLEGMFNDMRISRETRDKWKQYASSSSCSRNDLDIEVDVLTTGYWPSQSVPPCTLPTQVREAIDRFSAFYLEKHTGRKLSWQTSAGAAELKAVFGSGASGQPLRRHELCVSTYQMCILLLFNDADVLTLGQIRTKTHIPDLELRRQLISLCTPRNRILKKGSKGKGITSDDDTFTYNIDYTSKLKRVRIPLVKETSIGTRQAGGADGAGAAGMMQPGTAAGAAAGGSSTLVVDGSVPVAVEEDRRHLVEAAIVRIMKARKALNHNDLIAEVTKQLSVRFSPSPVFIKKRIESLIEREYLERAENEHRVYMYVA